MCSSMCCSSVVVSSSRRRSSSSVLVVCSRSCSCSSGACSSCGDNVDVW